MSLIGPRPERPEFVARLADTVPNYLDRLAVLPGVTGLAQINLPADDSLESVRQKVVLDREYIQTATFGQDLRIFFCTLFRMTGLRHGIAPWLFGVERDPDSVFLSGENCSEAVEWTGSLDDTAINIPSLIAVPVVGETAVFDVINEEQGQMACTAEAMSSTVQSDFASNTEKSTLRRPR